MGILYWRRTVWPWSVVDWLYWRNTDEGDAMTQTTIETRYEMLLDVAKQMAKALEHYRLVVASVNNPNDWTPQISDEGSHARCALRMWEAFREQQI